MAAENLVALRQFLRRGGEPQAAPTAAKYFHVVGAPAGVRFVLPSFTLEFRQDAVQQPVTVAAALRPVRDAAKGFPIVNGLGGDGSLENGWFRADGESLMVARPSADNRLQEEEQRH